MESAPTPEPQFRGVEIDQGIEAATREKLSAAAVGSADAPHIP
jgi:hypothetical protein